MNDNTYYIKIAFNSKLSEQKLADAFQTLWETGGVVGNYDLRTINDQSELIIRRKITDDAEIIHARLAHTVDIASVSQAAAEQLAEEFEQYEPFDLIADEYDQILLALKSGNFEILDVESLVLSELAVRQEIGGLFTAFTDASQQLIESAAKSQLKNGLIVVTDVVFATLAQALECVTDHDGVIAGYGDHPEHPIHAAWLVFESGMSHRNQHKNGLFLVSAESVDNLNSCVLGYQNAKRKYKADQEQHNTELNAKADSFLMTDPA